MFRSWLFPTCFIQVCIFISWVHLSLLTRFRNNGMIRLTKGRMGWVMRRWNPMRSNGTAGMCISCQAADNSGLRPWSGLQSPDETRSVGAERLTSNWPPTHNSPISLSICWPVRWWYISPATLHLLPLVSWTFVLKQFSASIYSRMGKLGPLVKLLVV